MARKFTHGGRNHKRGKTHLRKPGKDTGRSKGARY